MAYNLVDSEDSLSMKKIQNKEPNRGFLVLQRIILITCFLILGFVITLTNLSINTEDNEKPDADTEDKLIKEMILDLLLHDQEANMSSLYERESRSVDVQVRTQSNNQLVAISTRLVNVEKSLMMPKKARSDKEMFFKNQFDALEKIAPAPLAISLLSQIVLIAAEYKHDFSLRCNKNSCSNLEYPDSFKASLLQMSFATYESFNTAHVNMDEINRLMKLLPYEIHNAIKTLIKGSNEEIEEILPANIKSIKHIAKTAGQKARETVMSFDETKTVLEEIIMGATHTKYLSQKELEELNIEIEVERRWKQHYNDMKLQIKDEKDVLRAALEKSKTKFDEALDSLPSGWELVGMDFVEGLVTVLDWGATALSYVANPKDSILHGLRELLLYARKHKDGTNQKEILRSPISTAVNKLIIPDCIKNGSRYRATKNTNKKMDRHIAAEFLVALTDLIKVEEIIEQFALNVFEEKPGDKNDKKLRNDFINQSVQLEILTNDPRERVNALGAKMAFSQQITIFYRNIEDLADKFRKWKNRNVEELQKDTDDLLESSRCFRVWAEQTANYRSLIEPTPFSKPKQTTSTSNYASQRHMESALLKVESYQAQLEKAHDQYEEKIEKMLKNNENIRKTVSKLIKFDASKVTLKQVIRILQSSLMTMQRLRKNWLEILEFFQKIESITDVSLKNSLDDFSALIRTGKDFSTISTNFKGQLYHYVQDTMTTGFLIRRMSEVYLEISQGYILPPITELGELLELKDPQEIKQKKIKIDNQASQANQAIIRKTQEEQAAFDQQIKSRIKEINDGFAPILGNIAPKRKEEIKNVVQKGKKYSVIKWV